MQGAGVVLVVVLVVVEPNWQPHGLGVVVEVVVVGPPVVVVVVVVVVFAQPSTVIDQVALALAQVHLQRPEQSEGSGVVVLVVVEPPVGKAGAHGFSTRTTHSFSPVPSGFQRI